MRSAESAGLPILLNASKENAPVGAFSLYENSQNMNQQNFSRPTRVAQEIKKTLADLLLREAKDPRFHKINLTDCKISKDLAVAKVHFALIGHNQDDPEVANVLQALDKAKGYLRSELGRRLKLRIVPDIRFYYDSAPEHAAYIEDLINKALNK
ncbi:MAG: 30S ribosome-binding factor RbfA [Thiomicrorhabdus chilensis]|uniref:30S ribosome-binding factor RbfA n=1 Tax=Thiomicrorhabdus chilensis TaxID=63656 RepID=UPI00299DA6DD|nr:30S ribosome-binding factor RbfA [Thiomicrorhabdus chilensis]MDX1348462.1 30S ribosome-binding factor RbfA [Thiomicrorhabdus chilensis]